MRQEFLDRLQMAYSRELLIKLLADIDIETREVKLSLTRVSSEPNESSPRGRDRQNLISRIKDKIRHLAEEREMVRDKLGKIKHQKKVIGSVQKKQRFLKSFYAAAESTLSESQFLELEHIAAEQLNDKTLSYQ